MTRIGSAVAAALLSVGDLAAQGRVDPSPAISYVEVEPGYTRQSPYASGTVIVDSMRLEFHEGTQHARIAGYDGRHHVTSPRLSANYRPGGKADSWQFPKGAANIVIHRVRWLELTGPRRIGMACGEVEANLEGLVPDTYPYAFVPHTFKARFWAEIRREGDGRRD